MATKKKAAKKAGGKGTAKRTTKRKSFGCPGVYTQVRGNMLCIQIDRLDYCTVLVRCRGCAEAAFTECVWNGTSWDCTESAQSKK